MTQPSTRTGVARRAQAHAQGTRAKCIGAGASCPFGHEGRYILGLMVHATCPPTCETCRDVRERRCTEPHTFDPNATSLDRLRDAVEAMDVASPRWPILKAGIEAATADDSISSDLGVITRLTSFATGVLESLEPTGHLPPQTNP